MFPTEFPLMTLRTGHGLKHFLVPGPGDEQEMMIIAEAARSSRVTSRVNFVRRDAQTLNTAQRRKRSVVRQTGRKFGGPSSVSGILIISDIDHSDQSGQAKGLVDRNPHLDR